MAKFMIKLQEYSRASDTYGYNMARLTFLNYWKHETRPSVRWLKWDIDCPPLGRLVGRLTPQEWATYVP